MKTKDQVKIDIQEVSSQTNQETSTCAEEKIETSAAPLVSYNKEKKQWQTFDGRLFNTLKKAEIHLKHLKRI